MHTPYDVFAPAANSFFTTPPKNHFEVFFGKLEEDPYLRSVTGYSSARGLGENGANWS